jgi:hypothetical protein
MPTTIMPANTIISEGPIVAFEAGLEHVTGTNERNVEHQDRLRSRS